MGKRQSPALKRAARPHLGEEKGAEVIGLLLLVIALVLGTCFLSYRPDDPSFFQQSSNPQGVRNLIGPVGAQVSAAFFALLGITALVVPLLLVLAGWRRLRRRGAERVAGRGIGGLVLMAALPGLLQLTVGEFSWWGISIAAGGGLGILLSGFLFEQFGFAGALFLLLGAVVIGGALLLQSTFGELLLKVKFRLQHRIDGLRLRWARRRERREKEKSRDRVVAKHVRRAAEEKQKLAASITEAGGADGRIDLPLQVTEKPGQGAFSVRKVRHSGDVEPKPPPAPKSTRKKTVQRSIPFTDGEKPAGRKLPPLNLLQMDEHHPNIEADNLVQLGELIRNRCGEFGVVGTIEGISPGPVITVYEFQPAPGVKVSQIVGLQDELALALKVEAVRIDRILGRSTLGIEVPNRERGIIRLGPLLERDGFVKSPSPLTVALGTTIRGEPYFADLATMPHVLVAGATGSGKSVGLQVMITSIMYKAIREEVQFIFIDPKRIELGVYADIPHLKAEVVVSPKKAANALRWAVSEMERRYRLLAEAHVRSLDFYNRAIRDPEVRKRLSLSDDDEGVEARELKPLPYYVIVIDELADLMMVAQSEVETSIARLAQMARAVGIHLIVATQRPSVDVLTGTIKANFPCRIAYATATRHDSRTILDQIGAEKLLGKGDMLFMPPGTSRVMRLHGAYVTEQETAALIRWMKKVGPPELDASVLEAPKEERQAGGGDGGDGDELFDDAARLVVREQQASASFLQRRMRIGFSRAARLIDLMEQDGLLGPPRGSKPREVLVKRDFFSEIDDSRV